MNRPAWVDSIMIVGVGWALAGLALWLVGNSGDVRVVTTTLKLGLLASVLALPMALFLARAIDSGGWLGRIIWYACVASWVLPLFVHVSAWDALWGKLGWLVFWREGVEPIVSGWMAAVWVHGIAAAPQVALLLWLGLAMGGRTYEEQALVDADAVAVFWNVTVWRLVPWAAIGVAWILTVCAREIAVTDIYQIGTLAEEVYLGFSLGALENVSDTVADNASSRIPSWPLSITIVAWGGACLGAAVLRQIRIDEISGDWLGVRRSAAQHMRSWLRWLATFWLAVIAVVPVANLVIRACFRIERVEGQPVAGYSIANGLRAFADVLAETRSEIFWSSLLAVGAGLVGMILAVALSWLAIERRSWRWLLAGSIVLTWALPGPVIGLALVRLFTHPGMDWAAWFYDRSIFPAILATVIFYWPVVALLVWATLAHTARDALEHARLEGAGIWQRLGRIAVGQNRKTLLGCFLLMVALSWGELSANQMVLPPGILTVPRTMLGWLHSGVDERTAALALIVVIITVMLSLVGARWQATGLVYNKSDGAERVRERS